MTHSFEFTDEELDVLAYVLWEQDNSLAMLPPGQFVEQARNVRVVAHLAHMFDQRNREAHALGEAALADRVFEAIDTAEYGDPDDRSVAQAVIKIVREHDNPPEPEAPQFTDFDEFEEPRGRLAWE